MLGHFDGTGSALLWHQPYWFSLISYQAFLHDKATSQHLQQHFSLRASILSSNKDNKLSVRVRRLLGQYLGEKGCPKEQQQNTRVVKSLPAGKEPADAFQERIW